MSTIFYPSSIYEPFHLSVHQVVHSSISGVIYPFIYLSIYLCIYLANYLSSHSCYPVIRLCRCTKVCRECVLLVRSKEPPQTAWQYQVSNDLISLLSSLLRCSHSILLYRRCLISFSLIILLGNKGIFHFSFNCNC